MNRCIPAMIEAGQKPGDAPPSVASVQIGSASENTTVTGALASPGLGFGRFLGFLGLLGLLGFLVFLGLFRAFRV